MTPFNPFVGDYDISVLRFLMGDITLPGGTVTEGAAFNISCEDMKDWGYVDRSYHITQRGRDYVTEHGHRYIQPKNELLI